MATVTYTDLRANLAKHMERVCDDHDTLTVTRQGARSVVMLSEDEYGEHHGDAAPAAQPGQRRAAAALDRGRCTQAA